MKIRTLVMILLVVITTIAATAQPIEIMVVGASHNYGKQPVENFEWTKAKIRAFAPDIICTEDLSPADFDALTDRTNSYKVLDYVKSFGHPASKNLDKFIKHSYALLQKYPNYHQDRMRLAHALFMKHDFGNAYYQMDNLNVARTAFGPEENAYLEKLFGPVDSLKKISQRPNGEYCRIFYPMARELKHAQVYPMDCQRYDADWQQAWGKADSLFRVWDSTMEKDSTSADALVYAQQMKAYNQLNKKYNAMRKSSNFTAYLNTDEAAEFQFIDDFYLGTRLFKIKGFPQQEVQAKIDFWNKRNAEMCANTLREARTAKAKRVVVAVGASHAKLMRDMFSTMPGIKVIAFTGSL